MFFETETCVIFRAETLSDPLWITKKRTILIVIGMKTSILRQFWIASCSSEKGEVLLFSVHRQEAEMHRGEVSCSVTQRGSKARLRSFDTQLSAR